MLYAVTQLVSKVGSLLQLNSSSPTIRLPPELSTIQQTISPPTTLPVRSDTDKAIFFIVYNSLRDLTTVTLSQLDQFHQVAFVQSSDLNHWLLVSAFVFFCVFVVLSGLVIFPIVVGVQRNKVMILSIYFELPMSEIKSVHERCYDFLCKIDDERRNEALMIAQAGSNEQYVAEETKNESHIPQREDDEDEVNSSRDNTKRVLDSSRASGRNLMDGSLKFQPESILRKRKKKDHRNGPKSMNHQGEEPPEEEVKRRDSENSKEAEEE